MHRLGIISLFVFIIIAVLAPLISPHDPGSFDGPTLTAPNEIYLLGTNDLGQDILSQLIHGTRTSLIVGAVVALLSTFLSVTVGLFSGYNRRLDPYLMGLCNMILTIPNLLIVIIVVAFSGSNLWNVIFVLSLFSWPAYARIIRSQVLSVKEREYVKAARMFGAKQMYILYKHILPSLYPLILVKFVTTAQYAIAAEASLSFLGLGDVTEQSWGIMLHYAFQSDSIFISSAWQWWVLPPTICIVILTLSFSFLGYKVDEKTSLQRRRHKKQINIKEDGKHISHGQMQAEAKYNVLLQINNLRVSFPIIKRKRGEDSKPVAALTDVSLTLYKGDVLTLIGESGSGKTTLARAIVDMLPAAEITGAIYFQGESVMDMKLKNRNKLRWIDISIIFQDSKQALNPVLKVGDQIDEVLTRHKGMTKKEAQARTKLLLQDVRLNTSIVDMYPHELSGGMCSRVAIAMALACEPQLLIADEPTSSLDSLTRKAVMTLLHDKISQYNLTLLFITHDMRVAEEFANKIAVIKDGRIVEQASVREVFNNPKHPYTKKLVGIKVR